MTHHSPHSASLAPQKRVDKESWRLRLSTERRLEGSRPLVPIVASNKSFRVAGDKMLTLSNFLALWDIAKTLVSSQPSDTVAMFALCLVSVLWTIGGDREP